MPSEWLERKLRLGERHLNGHELAPDGYAQPFTERLDAVVAELVPDLAGVRGRAAELGDDDLLALGRRVRRALRQWGIGGEQHSHPDQVYNDDRSPTRPVAGLRRPTLATYDAIDYLGWEVHDAVLVTTGDPAAVGHARFRVGVVGRRQVAAIAGPEDPAAERRAVGHDL